MDVAILFEGQKTLAPSAAHTIIPVAQERIPSGV